ncbi:MAG TPA: corrinoid protein [Bacilli bacterium]|nr:corrinoid protein [Bacilli bacterium]HPZ27071.1 corrinoid protein [Bacilli bacterium]HQC89527.1 corrinoid protein [Bacilli bacterium]
MMILENISLSLQKGKAKDVRTLVQDALDAGLSPREILNSGLIQGMNVIGGKFKNNEVFVPEVLVAARAMNAGLEILRPVLTQSGVKPIGKAIICTVKGDLHDIGKNLVKMMLEGQAIDCLDLGVDVDSDAIIAAIKEHEPDLLCLSALLTTTMIAQKEIIADIERARLRDKVKIMVGGAPVTEAFAREIGADAYSPDAASAAETAVKILTGQVEGNV